MSVQTVSTNPMIIGLTGGISSGKSTASSYFKKLNIPVIDSDLIVHDLWEKNQKMMQAVENKFGFPVRTHEDRQKLGHLIFHDVEKRETLNQIVHPYVFEEIEHLKKAYQNAPFIVIDMPLLIEVGYQPFVDDVVIVYVDQETQIERLMERDQINRDEALAKIRSQYLLEEKIKHADHVLYNNTTKADLYLQIDAYLRGLKDEKQ